MFLDVTARTPGLFGLSPTIKVLLAAICLAPFGVACSGGTPGPFHERWRVDVGDARRCAVVEGGEFVVAVVDHNRLFVLRREDGAVAWKAELTASSPSAVAFYGDEILNGDWQGVLVALDAASGAERWSLTIPDSFYSPFAVEGDVLYCGAGEKVYAVDLVRKEVKWSTRLEEEAEVWAKPVVHDDRIFVEAGTHVFALAVETGEKLWEYETTSYAGGNYYDPVAVSGGRVFAGSPTKNILALDEGDGDERWSKPGAEGTWNSRLVVETYAHAGRVVFGFDAIITLEETTEGPDSENVGRVVCLSARNGRVKWTYDAPSFGDVAFADGNVYLASGSDVHVVNIKSGRGTAVPIPGKYSGGLTAAGDAVYFVVDGRYLVCGDFSP